MSSVFVFVFVCNIIPCCSYSRGHRADTHLLHMCGDQTGMCWGGTPGTGWCLCQCRIQLGMEYTTQTAENSGIGGRRPGTQMPRHPGHLSRSPSRVSPRHWYTAAPRYTHVNILYVSTSVYVCKCVCVVCLCVVSLCVCVRECMCFVSFVRVCVYSRPEPGWSSGRPKCMIRMHSWSWCVCNSVSPYCPPMTPPLWCSSCSHPAGGDTHTGFIWQRITLVYNLHSDWFIWNLTALLWFSCVYCVLWLVAFVQIYFGFIWIHGLF
jgi:hypothetical protein